MICKTVATGGGGAVIMCTRRGSIPDCDTPGCTRAGQYLCDHPVVRDGVQGTCDRRICDGHRTKMGAGRDYCGPHARRT